MKNDPIVKNVTNFEEESTIINLRLNRDRKVVRIMSKGGGKLAELGNCRYKREQGRSAIFSDQEQRVNDLARLEEGEGSH